MLQALADQARESATEVIGAVTVQAHRLYWLYLLTALVIAVAALYWTGSREGTRGAALVKNIFGVIFDRSIWLHRSAVVDYACYAINAAIGFVLRLAGLAGGVLTGGLVYLVLVLASGRMALAVAADAWMLGLYTLFAALVLDFGKYAGHYCLHRVPLLWEFHKVHHSAQVLTPITKFRVHPGEFLFYDFVNGLFLGIVSSIGLFVFGSQTNPMTILGLNAGVFLFTTLGANLRHSHIWLPYPSWLSHIFISPAQHQIHHSSLPQHHDANFGVMFALWDWMFGTLYVPKTREQLAFGLHEGEDSDYQSVRTLYLVPLQKVWRRIRRPPAHEEPATQPIGGPARP
jgi:sterol desaturase/sphingolipid hydroxylase (fatty acid hydroxylase superfamily)